MCGVWGVWVCVWVFRVRLRLPAGDQGAEPRVHGGALPHQVIDYCGRSDRPPMQFSPIQCNSVAVLALKPLRLELVCRTHLVPLTVWHVCFVGIQILTQAFQVPIL